MEPMKAIAYMRRSQDSGTGVSEEIQDEEIRAYVERKGGEVVHWLKPDMDGSSQTLDRPSMRKALELLAEGRANTLVVAKLSRVTRRRKDWEDLLELTRKQNWTIRSADFDVDLSTPAGRMIAGIIIDFLSYEYEEKRAGYDAARKNAVLGHGVHGGDKAPLGYEFTVRGHDKKGNPQRGPLSPTTDAERVLAGFEARASDDARERGWSNVVRVLDVKSQGNAAAIISNRAYLGEARSGAFVKPDAHPAIVPEELFRRANRKKSPRSVSYGTREGALLGGRILRCATCGYSLTHDVSKHGAHYRCKNLRCTARPSVQAAAIEPYVFFAALSYHAMVNSFHGAENAAAVPAREAELAQAQDELAEVETAFEAGELTPVAYGKALTAAERAVSAAEASLAHVEASRGWLGMDTDAVQRRLLGPGNVCKDTEAGRDFIRQMVRVVVSPVGRGRKVPVQDRVEVEHLTPLAQEEP